MSQAASPAPAEPILAQDENQLMAERREKLKALRQAQMDGKGVAFPNDFKPAAKAVDLHAAYGEQDMPGSDGAEIATSVAGRMVLKRVMGKASFATIQDGSEGDEKASRIQL